MKLQILGLLGAMSLAACATEATAETQATTESASTLPAASTHYPIVLMHGMGGFGKLEVGPIGITYFKDVVDELTRHGEQVFITIAPPYATSETRAAAIAPQLDEILRKTGARKLNLVGHSQGGLDARVLVSPNGLGYGDKVASVTTISTPHRGSKVADAVLGLIGGLPAEKVDEVLNTILEILEKTAYELHTQPDIRAQLTLLSEKYMHDVFNPKYTDNPNVTYTSYAGRTNFLSGVLACADAKHNNPFEVSAAQPLLFPLALFLEADELAVNDGLVTVDSARWGTLEECVPADHLQEVGQFGPFGTFDHLEMFRNIATRLHHAGF